jgi:hypothetical protein
MFIKSFFVLPVFGCQGIIGAGLPLCTVNRGKKQNTQDENVDCFFHKKGV